MPRNASGTYTLANSAFSPNTVISSSAVNGDFSDIATALTQSLATTGVSSMTGPILSADGSVSAPSIAFNSNQKTGFYKAGTNQIGWAANGVNGALFNSDTSVTWVGNQTLSGTLTVNGAATLNTTTAINGLLTIGAASGITFTAGALWNPSTLFGASGASHAIGTVPDPGSVAGTSRFLREDATWQKTTTALPTVQSFTAGSANYTPTANVTKIRVRMCGPGGGGGAQSTNNGSSGSAATSFGGWTANIGLGGGAGNGTPGAGGSGGSNGTGNLIVRISGSNGTGANAIGGGSSANLSGGDGGINPFGGNGRGVNVATGGSAVANTGGGGAGGGNNSGATAAGAGGGAGEYVEFWVNSPGTIAYVIGAGGAGGTAGVFAGGAGAAGIIIVEEYYN